MNQRILFSYVFMMFFWQCQSRAFEFDQNIQKNDVLQHFKFVKTGFIDSWFQGFFDVTNTLIDIILVWF